MCKVNLLDNQKTNRLIERVSIEILRVCLQKKEKCHWEIVQNNNKTSSNLTPQYDAHINLGDRRTLPNNNNTTGSAAM